MAIATGEKQKQARNVYIPHARERIEQLAGSPLAPFWARACAFWMDLLVVLIAYIPLMVLIEWLRSGRDPNAHIEIRWDFHEPGNIVFALLYFGLTLYFANGYTLGKRVFRIRVVSLVHERVTLWQAVERTLGYGASMLEAGFGFMQYFTNPNHCCVHDRIAETIVVKATPN